MKFNFSHIPSKYHKTLLVNIGFGLPHVNWFVIKKLEKGMPCECTSLSYGSECTALAYSVYQEIMYRLIGDIDKASKSHVVSVGANGHSDHFSISIASDNTFGALRKIASMSKYLNGASVFARYQANIRLLGGVAHREEFNWIVDHLHKSINGGVSMVVCGKINLKDTHIEKLKEVFTSKYQNPSVGSMSKPSSLSEKKVWTEYPHVKAKGILSIGLKHYVESVFKLPCALVDNHLIIYREKLDPAKLNDSKRIDNFVKPYAKKDGAELRAELIYSGMESPDLMIDCLKDGKTTGAEMAAFIKSSL